MEMLRGLGPRRNTTNNCTAFELEIDEKNKQTLARLIARPNPRLAEFQFFGVVEQATIVDLIFREGPYSVRSGLQIHEFGATSSPDPEEQQFIYHQSLFKNLVGQTLVHGHSHPNGMFYTGSHFVHPSETLLDPSSGFKDITSGADLGFYKRLPQIFPGLAFQYAGIVANTPSGPKFRVYQRSELLAIKKVTDITRLAHQTISLR